MSKKIPDWAKQPFTDFLENLKLLTDILHLSMKGIAVLRGIPDLMIALDGDSENVEEAKREAKIAQSEVKNGFPLLHAQASVSMWSSLEALIRTFLVSWLKNIPDAMSCDELKKVKIRLGEYESLSEDDRYFYILDLLEDSINTRRNPGVSRFNKLLEAFGITFTVDQTISRDLFELYHLRNVLVHRRGIADKKLVESCPWLNLSIGEPVIITHNALLDYRSASAAYVLELLQEIRVYFGLNRYEDSALTSVKQIAENEDHT